MPPPMASVWLINGIPGVGKTTTARALAARFQRAAHIEGDEIQGLIVSGAVNPGSQPEDEENRQIHLKRTSLEEVINSGHLAPDLD